MHRKGTPVLNCDPHDHHTQSHTRARTHALPQPCTTTQLEDQEVGRGSLQQLRNESQMFCGMVAVLCRHLKWDTLARLIQGLSVRIRMRVDWMGD
jgi:hypothetical protein